MASHHTNRTHRRTAHKETAHADVSVETAPAAPSTYDPAERGIYNERFARHREELEGLFRSLYGDSEELGVFESAMAAAHAMRPADLKALDRAREQDPEWYKRGDMFGMTMYTDLFAGDLKKLAGKIDYLKEQKLTYLHLMPLLDMPHPNNDGGYAVQDFDAVDPKLGTNQDLADLTAKLRKAGISLCLDFVMNHTASTHRWAKAAQAGDPEYQDYYFCYDDRTVPDEYDAHVPQVFPNTAPGNFTWNEKMHKWVMTQFYPFQWDLNYRNPKVFTAMMTSVMHLANLGVEVFRIDAVPYIWKQLGTNCRNLPEVHTIVRMMRIMLEVVCPAVVLKGEVVMAPKELAAYFGTPEHPECHMLYNVSIMVNLWGALATGDTRLLAAQLDKLNALPENCWFVNYLRCHDDIGWGLDEDEERRLGIDPFLHKQYLYHFYEGCTPGSWSMGELYNYDAATGDARSCGTTASLCGVEKALITHDHVAYEKSVRRDLLMHRACAFLRGFPMLNCGDEIGQLNGWEYKEDPDRIEDSRNLHRSPFDWSKAALREKSGTLQNRLWEGMEDLRAMRHDPCFAPDAWVTTWNAHDDGVLAVVRKSGSRVVVGVFNFRDSDETAVLDSIDGVPLPREIALEPYGSQVVVAHE
ncbi:alpha-amylase family protein [Bifidobacterium saguinibicoloris]|uniref:alpha-amylase family protein n=1 Tax=Bifidobacterium saguinibicoloris TaxID=2834433 RepID=UPI001C567781|nr:alpha-amylase family protein [Bifidobacterium saguinibicoloris]MBW3081240.1 alpha-amylase family protein [Bifidobacterium saguinibicoloris]